MKEVLSSAYIQSRDSLIQSKAVSRLIRSNNKRAISVKNISAAPKVGFLVPSICIVLYLEGSPVGKSPIKLREQLKISS